MKAICNVSLSRKGFDSAAGGIPSPIINGRFVSLPIPESGSGVFYKDMILEGTKLNFLYILRKLGAKQFSECHLDPNINPSLYGLDINKGWQPASGQDDTSTIHLIQTNKFKQGDIFLFFGRFRHAEVSNDSIMWVPGSKDFHAIFGFLEVGEIINIKDEFHFSFEDDFANHPHIKMRNENYYTSHSSLFIPAVKSSHGFNKTYGTFKFHQELVLSRGGNIINWKTPKSFNGKHFTYLGDIPKSGIIQAPGRGQEMVGKADEKMIDWISEIIVKHST